MSGGRLLEDTLLASPERAARAAHNVLAAVAVQSNFAERPEYHPDYAFSVLMATGFVAHVLSSLAAQQPHQQQAIHLVCSIAGLPAFLAAYMPLAAAQGEIRCLNNFAWLLQLATHELPEDSPQHLTPQQLERTQLPRLLQQLQLHGASPLESLELAELHVVSVDIIARVAAVHGGQQQLRLLLGYWRGAGVHQLQVGATRWPVQWMHELSLGCACVQRLPTSTRPPCRRRCWQRWRPAQAARARCLLLRVTLQS